MLRLVIVRQKRVEVQQMERMGESDTSKRARWLDGSDERTMSTKDIENLGRQVPGLQWLWHLGESRVCSHRRNWLYSVLLI